MYLVQIANMAPTNLHQRTVLFSVFINHQELEVKIKLNNLTNSIK